MGTFEQGVAIANLGNAIPVGSAVDNHILTNHVVIANLNIRLGTTEVKVLRQCGYHTALVDFVALADTRAVAN